MIDVRKTGQRLSFHGLTCTGTDSIWQESAHRISDPLHCIYSKLRTSPLHSRHRLIQSLSLLIAICFLFAAAFAQQVPSSAFSGLKWRMIGPFRGGRAIAVAGIPGNASTFYFGSVDGGVWKTTDAGVVWKPIFDGQPVGSIGAIAVAPSNPEVIYVGTGEADIRSDLASGNGVYKSTDG